MPSTEIESPELKNIDDTLERIEKLLEKLVNYYEIVNIDENMKRHLVKEYD